MPEVTDKQAVQEAALESCSHRVCDVCLIEYIKVIMTAT